MTKVFVISLYEYDTYSYSGISLNETELFASEDGARKWATDKKYTIVEYVKNPDKEVTLSTQEVHP